MALLPGSAIAQEHQHEGDSAETVSPETPTVKVAPNEHTQGSMDHSQPGHSAMEHDRTDQRQMDHGSMDHAAMGHTAAEPDHAHAMAMAGEGSGTSRLPANETTSHGAMVGLGGDASLMLHGFIWPVYTDQSGPRGDDKLYVQ